VRLHEGALLVLEELDVPLTYLINRALCRPRLRAMST
jgi:hypothetical protein